MTRRALLCTVLGVLTVLLHTTSTQSWTQNGNSGNLVAGTPNLGFDPKYEGTVFGISGFQSVFNVSTNCSGVSAEMHVPDMYNVADYHTMHNSLDDVWHVRNATYNIWTIEVRGFGLVYILLLVQSYLCLPIFNNALLHNTHLHASIGNHSSKQNNSGQET
jgi:hypothetical protein